MELDVPGTTGEESTETLCYVVVCEERTNANHPDFARHSPNCVEERPHPREAHPEEFRGAGPQPTLRWFG